MPAAAADLDEISSASTGWYTTEIQNMMHGFGDSPNPLIETAEFIEHVVKEQLLQILNCLMEVADIRESSWIGMEEFLFLLRHSPVKLRRFCHYLHVQDVKKKLMESNADDPHKLDFAPVGESTPKNPSKKLTSALRFLHCIDPSGFLSRAADPNRESILKDENFRERMSRIEHMTISMDVQQYLEYSKARQSSFGRHPATTKFRDWLFKNTSPPNITIKAKAWDFLSYLAYETVGQIVDLAFILRRDKSTPNVMKDALERNLIPRQLSVNANSTQPPWSSSVKPLQPAEVSEAIQRFNTSSTVLSPFTRNIVLHSSRKLLAL